MKTISINASYDIQVSIETMWYYRLSIIEYFDAIWFKMSGSFVKRNYLFLQRFRRITT